MRWKLVSLIVGCTALCGCIQSVKIPQQEAALKDACHGKDRILASRAGISIYRCGEGDQAKYAAYVNGALANEGNEIVALGAVAELDCAGSGLKSGTPEFATCVQGLHGALRDAAGGLRTAENTAAENRQRRAIAAAGAAAGAASAAIAASQPQTVRIQTNCTSSRLGSFVNTNCF